MRLGRHEVSCQDGWRVLERYPEDLMAVGAKQVKDVMQRYFTRDNRSVGWSLPGGKRR
jgi:predicted Zn-dependent peptidase